MRSRKETIYKFISVRTKTSQITLHVRKRRQASPSLTPAASLFQWNVERNEVRLGKKKTKKKQCLNNMSRSQTCKCVSGNKYTKMWGEKDGSQPVGVLQPFFR